MAIQVEVWGEYACFTRPEMKTERVSYVLNPRKTIFFSVVVRFAYPFSLSFSL